LNDTQKKIEDTILKLEQRLKFAKTPEQWDNIKDRIERLQAGLNRSKQGVAENKKGVRAAKHTVKPRNFVAKNAVQSGAGAHKDKKKAAKQGDTKHKATAYENRLESALQSALMEKAPKGWEGTVKAMKKHDEIENPYALAHYMKNKGYKSHKKK
jgi:hypothetical protein